MTPEEKQLLEDTLRLSKENNKILRTMRRSQFWANIISYIKWIILVIITIWSWVILQPYFDKMTQMYAQVQETTKTVGDLKVKAEGAFDGSGLQNILDTFRIGTQ